GKQREHRADQDGRFRGGRFESASVHFFLLQRLSQTSLSKHHATHEVRPACRKSDALSTTLVARTEVMLVQVDTLADSFSCPWTLQEGSEEVIWPMSRAHARAGAG